ncbi:MAG: hypothetical protein RL653_3370 [Pseudomonadota bacterium]
MSWVAECPLTRRRRGPLVPQTWPGTARHQGGGRPPRRGDSSRGKDPRDHRRSPARCRGDSPFGSVRGAAAVQHGGKPAARPGSGCLQSATAQRREGTRHVAQPEAATLDTPGDRAPAVGATGSLGQQVHPPGPRKATGAPPPWDAPPPGCRPRRAARLRRCRGRSRTSGSPSPGCGSCRRPGRCRRAPPRPTGCAGARSARRSPRTSR